MSTVETGITSFAKKVRGVTKEDVKDKIKKVMQTDINTEWLQRFYRNPKYVAMLEVFQYVVFLLILYYFNPFNISTKYPRVAQLTTLIVAFILIMLFYFLRDLVEMDKMVGFQAANVNSKPTENRFVLNLLSTFFAFGAFFVSAKLIWWLFSQGNMSQIITVCCTFLLVSGALGLLYLWLAPKISKARLDSQTTLLGFLWKFIMYIPCLLLIFLDFVKKEYNITTQPVWMLLGFEVLVVFVWFFLPNLLNKALTADGVQLLRDPLYLNMENTLKMPKKYRQGAKEKVEEDKKNNYAYSLSAWFYINPQPPNTGPAYTKYTPILNYGNQPVVEFNAHKNTLRIRAEKGGPEEEKPARNVLQTIVLSKNVPLQKWNNIVLNYDRGSMDVFLNGLLIGSKPSIAPYMTLGENVKVGQIDGIQGGICNVMYYDKILLQQDIVRTYKLLRSKKIPVL